MPLKSITRENFMKMGRTGLFMAVTGLSFLFAVQTTAAQTDEFQQIVEDVRAEARQRGINEAAISRGLNGIEPLHIKKFETNQPETSREITFAEYYGRRATPAAISKGRQFLNDHRQAFEKIEHETGVPAAVIVAILSIESNYGANTGDKKVIPALLTLVRDIEGETKRAKDRRKMFKEEALQALKLLDEGYDEIVMRNGSWAGAVGPAQFMPSSIRSYAVDGDGDGRKNMWTDYDDVLPSIANFLQRKGWNAGERWGRKVMLPEGFSKALLTDTLLDQHNKTPTEWADLGVKMADGSALPQNNTMSAMLIAPNYNVKTGEFKGPVYMVYDNFRTTMQYNKSYKYALTVLQMADMIGKGASPAPSRKTSQDAPVPYNQ